MFTGIVTAIGTVRDTSGSGGGRDVTFDVPWSDIDIGESIAVDGACLTVTQRGDGWFSAHLISTSLDRTTFNAHAAGRRVNLERALRAGDRLGGHIVQGHVDGVGTIRDVERRADARLLTIVVPSAVAAVSIALGSITVDGVSLTINAIPTPGVIQVALIPFTLEHTTLGERARGDQVHLEGDTVGKYVQQLAAPWRAAEPG
jgi:riboflavin synthase